MPTQTPGPSTERRDLSKEDLADMIEDRDETIARLRSALQSIAAMTKEREHDLFSATQVAARALGD
jgi:ribosome-binding protein aMBF1 (putative translation factor)